MTGRRHRRTAGWRSLCDAARVATRSLLCGGLILPLALSGCGDLIPSSLKNEHELVILTHTGTLTYSAGDEQEPSGFDYDLVRRFAEEAGLTPRVVVVANDAELLRRLKAGEGHLAAAWQIPVDDPAIRHSHPYFESRNVLVKHEASLPITGVRQLAHKTVAVQANSRQAAALKEIKQKVPLTILSRTTQSELDLLADVASRHHEAALVNNAVFDIGNNFYPELQSALEVGPTKPIVWLFSPQASPELIAQADAFLDRMRQDGELDRLRDRYFGHVNRLTQADTVRFIEDMRTLLPQYRLQFQAAQTQTGIDWRLLAALAYQESRWQPLATSPTGVRGMMMLTAETADSLGISNRLDPEQSIGAGAQYLNELRETLPETIHEPDRTWMALAAYNVGMGHLNAARYLAKTLKADPDSWFAMKKVLPLLAKPQYYQRLKSGKGRGGEAVIMTENIRVYNDILNRHEQPYKVFRTSEKPSKAKPVVHGKPRGDKKKPVHAKSQQGAHRPAAQNQRSGTSASRPPM